MVSKAFKVITVAVAFICAITAASAATTSVSTTGTGTTGAGTYTFLDGLNPIGTVTVNYSSDQKFLYFSFQENSLYEGDVIAFTINYNNNGANPAAPASYSFTGTGVDAVALQKLGGNGASFTGASVLFNAPVPAVPEPESYAMLLAGLGLIGTIAVRRRTKEHA